MGGAAGEDDSVLEGLAGTLSEVGSHRVGGIADQGDPAFDVGGQRREIIEVVVQEVGFVGLGQQLRDGLMPVGEPVAKGGQVGAVGPFVDVRCREAVDPTVRQRGVAETFTVTPGLAAWTDVHRVRGHEAPGRVAGVPG